MKTNTFFHITAKENILSIFENGLIPQIGERSKEFEEKEPAIYLFKSKEDLEDALSNWIGNWYTDNYGDDFELCILEIKLPTEFPVIISDNSFEAITNQVILSEYIQYFDESGNEIHPEYICKENKETMNIIDKVLSHEINTIEDLKALNKHLTKTENAVELYTKYNEKTPDEEYLTLCESGKLGLTPLGCNAFIDLQMDEDYLPLFYVGTFVEETVDVFVRDDNSLSKFSQNVLKAISFITFEDALSAFFDEVECINKDYQQIISNLQNKNNNLREELKLPSSLDKMLEEIRNVQEDSKPEVISNEIYSPQNFLGIMTGETFILGNNEDVLTQIEDILDEYGYDQGEWWNFPLNEIDEVFQNDRKVVLVDCSDYDVEQHKVVNEYRWFEVPDDFKDMEREYNGIELEEHDR